MTEATRTQYPGEPEDPEKIRLSFQRALEGPDGGFTGVRVSLKEAPPGLLQRVAEMFERPSPGHLEPFHQPGQIDLSLYFRIETNQGNFGLVYSVFSVYDLTGLDLDPNAMIPKVFEGYRIPEGFPFLPTMPLALRNLRAALGAKMPSAASAAT